MEHNRSNWTTNNRHRDFAYPPLPSQARKARPAYNNGKGQYSRYKPYFRSFQEPPQPYQPRPLTEHSTQKKEAYAQRQLRQVAIAPPAPKDRQTVLVPLPAPLPSAPHALRLPPPLPVIPKAVATTAPQPLASQQPRRSLPPYHELLKQNRQLRAMLFVHMDLIAEQSDTVDAGEKDAIRRRQDIFAMRSKIQELEETVQQLEAQLKVQNESLKCWREANFHDPRLIGECNGRPISKIRLPAQTAVQAPETEVMPPVPEASADPPKGENDGDHHSDSDFDDQFDETFLDWKQLTAEMQSKYPDEILSKMKLGDLMKSKD